MLNEITRKDWEDGNAKCLSKGRAGNARVYRIDRPEGIFVIKDFRKSPWWIRWTWGRWMINHEYQLLHELDGVKGVPQKVFRVDAYAFGMAFMPGVSLGDVNQQNTNATFGLEGAEQRELSPLFFRRLERLMCSIHRRGVTHLDARNAKNVMVLPGDWPALIDFQSGVRLKKWLPKWVKRLLKLADLSSVYKHYFRYYYDGQTEQIHEPTCGFPPNRAQILLAHLKLRKLWMLKGYSFLQKRKTKDWERCLIATYQRKEN